MWYLWKQELLSTNRHVVQEKVTRKKVISA